MRKTLLVATIIILQSAIPVAAQVSKDDGSNWRCDGNDSDFLRERYGLFINNANYIKIRIRDTETGNEATLVMDNVLFADFWAMEHGLRADKHGRFLNHDLLMKYRDKEYVDYMVRNHGKILDINLKRLQDYIKRPFGKRKAGKEFLKRFFIDRPMSFEELGVKDEKGLVKKYFVFEAADGCSGRLEERYQYEGLGYNPAFQATLFDMGYVVSLSCWNPSLHIYKRIYQRIEE